MKKLIKILVLSVFISGGFSAHASSGLNVKISEKQTLVVELEHVKKGSLLYLQTENGEILFVDSLETETSYKKSLDLAVIPRGTYVLNLEKENAIFTSIIVKSKEGLKIVGDSSGVVFKPCYKVKEDKVLVFLSNPQNSITQLKVYDYKGELVGSSTDGKNIFKRTLDFSDMPAGEYTINIQVGNRNFSKTVNLSKPNLLRFPISTSRIN